MSFKQIEAEKSLIPTFEQLSQDSILDEFRRNTTVLSSLVSIIDRKFSSSVAYLNSIKKAASEFDGFHLYLGSSIGRSLENFATFYQEEVIQLEDSGHMIGIRKLVQDVRSNTESQIMNHHNEITIVQDEIQLAERNIASKIKEKSGDLRNIASTFFSLNSSILSPSSSIWPNSQPEHSDLGIKEDVRYLLKAVSTRDQLLLASRRSYQRSDLECRRAMATALKTLVAKEKEHFESRRLALEQLEEAVSRIDPLADQQELIQAHINISPASTSTTGEIPSTHYSMATSSQVKEEEIFVQFHKALSLLNMFTEIKMDSQQQQQQVKNMVNISMDSPRANNDGDGVCDGIYFEPDNITNFINNASNNNIDVAITSPVSLSRDDNLQSLVSVPTTARDTSDRASSHSDGYSGYSGGYTTEQLIGLLNCLFESSSDTLNRNLNPLFKSAETEVLLLDDNPYDFCREELNILPGPLPSATPASTSRSLKANANFPTVTTSTTTATANGFKKFRHPEEILSECKRRSGSSSTRWSQGHPGSAAASSSGSPREGRGRGVERLDKALRVLMGLCEGQDDRDVVTQCLSLFRSKKVELSSVSFEFVGALFWCLLDHCQAQNDIRNAKTVMMLSQTFYRIIEIEKPTRVKKLDSSTTHESKASRASLYLDRRETIPLSGGNGGALVEVGEKRQYVKDCLVSHVIWKEERFWEQTLWQLVTEQLQSMDLGSPWYEHSVDSIVLRDMVARVHEVSFNQLMAVAHSMMELHYSLDKARDLVRRMSTIHQLPEPKRFLLLRHLELHLDKYHLSPFSIKVWEFLKDRGNH